MKTRLISAALVAAVMSLLWFFSQRHNTSIEARVREMETGVPAWDASAAKDAVSKANESWQTAMQAVATHKPKEAFDAYHRAVRGNTAFPVKNYPDKEAGQGLTLRRRSGQTAAHQ